MKEKKRIRQFWADDQDIRMMKIIASIQGMTMSQYIKEKVAQDTPKIKQHLDDLEKKKKGGVKFDKSPF